MSSLRLEEVDEGRDVDAVTMIGAPAGSPSCGRSRCGTVWSGTTGFREVAVRPVRDTGGSECVVNTKDQTRKAKNGVSVHVLRVVQPTKP